MPPAPGAPAPEQVAAFFQKHRTGLVTLVFTDLADSTALLSQLGDQAGASFLQRRRQIIREVLSTYAQGEEIETAGDSFLLAFAKPSDAVRWALQVQARLRVFSAEGRLPVQERIGIHLGEVVIAEQERAGKAKDFYGIQLATCARVMGLAAGGQVLLTRGVFDSARAVLKGEDVEGVGSLSWVSHGSFVLKGVEEAVEVCEVGEAGLSLLEAPKTTEKAQRVVAMGEEPVLGWRPAIGQPVPNTKWRLEEKLGEGGFGEVWKARHEKLSESRVFKFCFRADRVRSLKREVTLFRLLKERVGEHPNIVKLHDIYFDQPPYYLEEEYVEGKDLRSWCAAQGGPEQVPLEARLEMVAQAAEGLQAAHDAGVIHRDVKPGNILVSGQSEAGHSSLSVKLSDFGIGQVVSEEYLAGVTRAGFTQTMSSTSSSQTGTQLYLAPEILAGKPASTRSDIYSLGVVLYQLLVGDFGQPVTGDWMEGVRDPLLRDDLKHCLAGKPEERFAGAAQLAENLRSLPRRQRELVERNAARQKAEQRKRVSAILTGATVVFVLVALALSYGLREARRQRAIAQGRLYAAQMKLAREAHRAGKTGGAMKTLEAQRPVSGQPDFRGFDWRHLYGLCLSSPSEVLATNRHGFQAAGFTPQGHTVALGSADGFVELFDVPTRQSVKRWQAHAGAVDALAFYPNNTNWLATVSGMDGLLKLWDIDRAGVSFLTNVAQGMMVNFAFSPKGKYLATLPTNAPSVSLWDFHAGLAGVPPRLTLKTNLPFLGPTGFSPDERTAVVCNQMAEEVLFTVALYDLAEGTLTRLPELHGNLIMAVTFSPDGALLATGSADERVVVWDLKRRVLLRAHRTDLVAITSLAFAPDGQTLFASGYDQNLCAWRTEDPAQLHAMRGHSAAVQQLAVAADGRSLASASGDGTARLWRLPTSDFASGPSAPGEFTTLFPPKDREISVGKKTSVFGLAVSPAQDRVVAAEDRELLSYHSRSGILLNRVAITNVFQGGKPTFARLAFSPEGRQLAVGSDDGRVAFLDADSFRPARTPIRPHANQVSHIAYALNGKVLVTGGGFGNGITLTDLVTGRTITQFSGVVGLFPMQPLAISHDGKRLATGSPEGWVCVWDIASLQLVAHSQQKLRALHEVVFAPDDNVLAFGDEKGAIVLWDLTGKRPLRRLVGHAGMVNALAFSPDGRTLASGGMDHTIRLWHPEIDQEVAILQGHQEWVWCVGFADQGNALFSGGRDGTLKLWRAPSFAEIDTAGKRQSPTATDPRR